MVCEHPISLELGRTVPCGRCMPCRRMRTSQWAQRMIHELPYHDYSVFVTLTYDDVHLPISHNLVPKDLQDYFKRLRFDLGDDFPKIKYYACGEYGETFYRPHYHAIIFGLGVQHEAVIHDAWGKGFVKVGSVTIQSCRYVAAYILDKDAPSLVTITGERRTRPFQRASQGLGRRWLEDNRDRVLVDGGVRCAGTIVGMPRYYKKLLKDYITDEMADIAAVIRSEVRTEVYNRLGVEELGRAGYESAMRQQKIEEARYKEKRRKAKRRGL